MNKYVKPSDKSCDEQAKEIISGHPPDYLPDLPNVLGDNVEVSKNILVYTVDSA